MIAMKLGWLVLEGLLIWCFAWFGSGVALALALLLVLVPLCTIPISLHLRKKLEVGIEAALSLRKGDEATITVKLENPTIFAALRVRCDVVVQNQLNRETLKQHILTWAGPKKMQKCSLRIASEYCGRLRVWVPQVVLYDCFGIFGIRCKCNAVTHMTVQAETFEPNVVLVPNPSATDDSESYSQDRPGADLTETFQLREYVPGDSPRQIHWKLTNKFDKLIVRDPGLPISKNVLVFWERTGESGDPDLIDAQAEVIISLCRSLVDMGIQFTVGWNDTDRNLCITHRIREMDEFVGIIPRLLRATGAKEGMSGAGLLIQTRSEELCAHMVYIAETPQSDVMEMQRYGHVTMLLCGEAALDGAVCFNEMDYIKQLTEIEI